MKRSKRSLKAALFGIAAVSGFVIGGSTLQETANAAEWNARPVEQIKQDIEKSNEDYYEVKPFDTLSGIADAVDRDMYDLARINEVKDVNKIYVGQKIFWKEAKVATGAVTYNTAPATKSVNSSTNQVYTNAGNGWTASNNASNVTAPSGDQGTTVPGGNTGQPASPNPGGDGAGGVENPAPPVTPNPNPEDPTPPVTPPVTPDPDPVDPTPPNPSEPTLLDPLGNSGILEMTAASAERKGVDMVNDPDSKWFCAFGVDGNPDWAWFLKTRPVRMSDGTFRHTVDFYLWDLENDKPVEQPVRSASAETPVVVEKAPAAETPVETPAVVEETPVVETPAVVEETPVVETPAVVEETPVVEAPAVVEETPVEETPAVVEETPVVETPAVVEETPVVETPAVIEDASVVAE